MHFVQVYGLHAFCALVDLDSFCPLVVRPTTGLKSSTQVVCVCVRAYTSAHPSTIYKHTPEHIELPAKMMMVAFMITLGEIM